MTTLTQSDLTMIGALFLLGWALPAFGHENSADALKLRHFVDDLQSRQNLISSVTNLLANQSNPLQPVVNCVERQNCNYTFTDPQFENYETLLYLYLTREAGVESAECAKSLSYHWISTVRLLLAEVLRTVCSLKSTNWPNSVTCTNNTGFIGESLNTTMWSLQRKSDEKSTNIFLPLSFQI